jgi:hypothetical protein
LWRLFGLGAFEFVRLVEHFLLVNHSPTAIFLQHLFWIVPINSLSFAIFFIRALNSPSRPPLLALFDALSLYNPSTHALQPPSAIELTREPNRATYAWPQASWNPFVFDETEKIFFSDWFWDIFHISLIDPNSNALDARLSGLVHLWLRTGWTEAGILELLERDVKKGIQERIGFILDSAFNSARNWSFSEERKETLGVETVERETDEKETENMEFLVFSWNLVCWPPRKMNPVVKMKELMEEYEKGLAQMLEHVEDVEGWLEGPFVWVHGGRVVGPEKSIGDVGLKDGDAFWVVCGCQSEKALQNVVSGCVFFFFEHRIFIL